METRRKYATIGLPILVFLLIFPLVTGWIKLVDISQIIITALVSGIVGLAVYGFKPKDSSLTDNEIERRVIVEQRAKMDTEEKLRQENLARLDFGTISKAYVAELMTAGLISYTAYYIDVKRISGKEYAEKCEAFLSISDTKFNNQITIWKDSKSRYDDIGTTSRLFLFGIVENENRLYLFKPATEINKNVGIEITTYKDLSDKELTINLMTRKGIAPQPISKKIKDIIAEAKSIE